jgi:hypothetical protein
MTSILCALLFLNVIRSNTITVPKQQQPDRNSAERTERAFQRFGLTAINPERLLSNSSSPRSEPQQVMGSLDASKLLRMPGASYRNSEAGELPKANVLQPSGINPDKLMSADSAHGGSHPALNLRRQEYLQLLPPGTFNKKMDR